MADQNAAWIAAIPITASRMPRSSRWQSYGPFRLEKDAKPPPALGAELSRTPRGGDQCLGSEGRQS